MNICYQLTVPGQLFPNSKPIHRFFVAFVMPILKNIIFSLIIMVSILIRYIFILPLEIIFITPHIFISPATML